MIEPVAAVAAEELTAADLERLSALLAVRSGLAFPESRWPLLRNRAREVMAHAAFVSARRWLAELEASAAKRGSLFCEMEEALQVHETAFFRYAAHHRVLAEVVLPALVRVGGPRVRILSVGCSTGEEPYSIAMTVRETVRRVGPSAVEILALDTSRAALVAGVRGMYPAASVGAVPAPWRAKYLVPGPEGLAVGPTLREMVRFRHHDIRRGFYVGKFDVIFVCNVLPYFTPAMRRQALGRLIESMAGGGYLFLGHAEGITPPAAFFDPREAPGAFVYRRNHQPADGADTGVWDDPVGGVEWVDAASALAGDDGHGG